MGESRVPLIILASYDDKERELPAGKALMSYVKELARKEKRKKGAFTNHYLWRNSTNHANSLKHNYLLDGKPIIWYSLEAALVSRYISDVVVCTNEDGGKNISAFREFNGKRIKEKAVDYVYVNEGDPQEWTIEQAVTKSIAELKKKGYSEFVLAAGDEPFVNSFDDIARRDLAGKEIIYDFNSKENIWGISGEDPGPFPRFYHWRVKVPSADGTERVHHIKETQAFKSTIQPIEKIATLAYESRKIEKGGWNHLLKSTLLKKGNLSFALKYILQHEHRLGMQLGYDLFKITVNEAYSAAKKNLGLSTYTTEYEKFNFQHYIPKLKTANDILCNSLGIKGQLIVENKNPGLLEDVDSLEDLFCLEMFLKNAEKKTDVSKNHEALCELEKYAMPKLKKDVELYGGFYERINWFCTQMDLAPFYFGDYINENLFPQFTEDMIKKGIEKHKEYNSK